MQSSVIVPDIKTFLTKTSSSIEPCYKSIFTQKQNDLNKLTSTEAIRISFCMVVETFCCWNSSILFHLKTWKVVKIIWEIPMDNKCSINLFKSLKWQLNVASLVNRWGRLRSFATHSPYRLRFLSLLCTITYQSVKLRESLGSRGQSSLSQNSRYHTNIGNLILRFLMTLKRLVDKLR